ncbi:MAG: FGGY family carbohydrate kinase [Chloroflexota bacterium]
MAMHVLTLDQGTSSLKAALWREDGVVLAEALEAYELSRPAPTWAEIDPARWWDALCTATRAVLAQAAVAADDVACVALDGIGWTLVATDADLRPVVPAMTWLDRRAEAEAEALRARPDAETLVDLDANRIDAAYLTPKVAWLAGHRPDAFDATRWLLTASGWLVARLTGEVTCDLTQAYGFHCFDLRRERWDEATAASLGIPLDRLPPIKRAGHVAGGMTHAAAFETGLSAGIPVIVGGLDAAMGALGGGVTRPGLTQDQGGSAGGFAISVTGVVVEPRLIFSHHVLEGQYLLQAGTVGGGSLGWLRRIVGADEASFEALISLADDVPAGAHGVMFLPYMAGERTPLWSSAPRGVFAGLSYATTRADLVRAVLEGSAFANVDNLRIAQERGHRVTTWLGQGGASRSATWNQIKADATGVAPRPPGRGRVGGWHGARAVRARGARAAGLAGSPAETVERLLVQRTTLDPGPGPPRAIPGAVRRVARDFAAMLRQFDRLAGAA